MTAPIVGARTLRQLADNLGAAALMLDAEATAALEAVSAPRPGGYPYGAFGAWQRGRWMQDWASAPPQPFAGGSRTPLGAAG